VRALLALAPRLFERCAQILDQLILLLEPEVLLFGEPVLLAVDAARHLKVELAGAGFERLSFLAQLKLGLLRLPAPAPLCGELAFEKLLFDGEIRARLLFALAGENLQARLVLVAKLFLERLAERDFGATAGAGNHGRVHGRLFTAGRINAPCSQACSDRDRLRRGVRPESAPTESPSPPFRRTGRDPSRSHGRVRSIAPRMGPSAPLTLPCTLKAVVNRSAFRLAGPGRPVGSSPPFAVS
jgi:hypothetical protein